MTEFVPMEGVTLFEFYQDVFYIRKLSMHGPSCNVVCMIQSLAVLTQYQRVTDTCNSIILCYHNVEL